MSVFGESITTPVCDRSTYSQTSGLVAHCLVSVDPTTRVKVKTRSVTIEPGVRPERLTEKPCTKICLRSRDTPGPDIDRMHATEVVRTGCPHVIDQHFLTGSLTDTDPFPATPFSRPESDERVPTRRRLRPGSLCHTTNSFPTPKPLPSTPKVDSGTVNDRPSVPPW